MIAIVDQAAPELGVAPTCAALGLSRATYYRRRDGEVYGPKPARPKPARALSTEERQEVLDTLHEERFVDQPPAEIYGQLLDEGKHLCSVRTMYRILADNEEVRERRNQRVHPANAIPRLCATAPNQVWTWDISVPQKAAREMRDRPLAIGLQEQVANHRKRLGSKALVVSVAEKVPLGIR